MAQQLADSERAREISDPEYVRQRTAPRAGDLHYLIASDLLLALQDAIAGQGGSVLDYGCGGSPYRSLFNASLYHRADLAGGSALDFEFGRDSRLAAPSAQYDCVLSSQVLQYAPSPSDYLAECHRVLKPEGKLILTTHGLFPEHGYPTDYWRWTAGGLSRLVEDAGFRIGSVMKMTTGPRAAVYFAERAYCGAEIKRAGLARGAALVGLPILQKIGARSRHRACDACFAGYRVVAARAPGHDSYIGIVLAAYRQI